MTRDHGQLRDEIALREASLVDARREVASGELSSEAFGAIEAREQVALATARASLEALGVSPDPTTQRPRVRRTRYLIVAVTCFVLALGVLLWSALSPRQAGTPGTGSITLGHAQQITQLLNEAEADIANGNVVTALAAYQRVLTLDPKNVPALTQTGWLDFSAGSSARNATLTNLGVKYLHEAITIAPRLAAPRLYYAIVADATPGNQKLARREFEIFLALHPSKGQLAVATPFLRKLGLFGS